MVFDWDALNQYPIAEVLAWYGIKSPNREIFRLRCPLHGSGNPTTMAFNRKTNLFFCYACHQGGTAVNFVAAMEKISIKAAAEMIDKRSPVTKVDPLSIVARDTWRRLREAEVKEAPEIAEPEGLADPQTDRVSPATLAYFGVRQLGEDIYFPFRDVGGRLIGYSLRRGGKPKYWNSRGFHKGRFLYGLYENQEEIRQARSVILVEGQFDVLALWDRGDHNVVGVMGSLLSREQAKLLLPLVDKLIVIFDGDEAGRNGARTLREQWSHSFIVEIIDLPEGTDPAESIALRS